jgi:deoxyribodipyrimidine photo-lyase
MPASTAARQSRPAPHPLDGPFVREQLERRTTPLNERRTQPDGEYVLYWMQATQRLEENWALRGAIRIADRFNRPLLVYQGLNPHYEHASDRVHAFIIGNAAELARQAPALGLTYRFHLRETVAGDNRVVDRLAARAVCVVTDAYPTAGVDERSARVAARVPCRMLAIDGHGVIPAGAFTKEEYAARTIRPKILRLRELSLEPVEERPPRVPMSDALLASLDLDATDLRPISWSAPQALDAMLARCEIDHGVPVVREIAPGATAARARLAAFCGDALADYQARRGDPTDDQGSSRLSPWLHYGQISAAEVARTVMAHGPAAEADKFLDELLTWRELSLNFCTRNRAFRTMEALPGWARESLARHAGDPREALYDLDAFERAATHHPLWNAAQRELLLRGTIHNVMRMYWGKYVLLWTRDPAEAMRILVHLNNRWGLDGRDPSSHAGIQWCFGKFDRPWTRRPVLGTVRYMSIDLAYKKFDARGYERRWGAP